GGVEQSISLPRLVSTSRPASFSIRWVISNLAQKFSFVINRFDSQSPAVDPSLFRQIRTMQARPRTERRTHWLAVIMREAPIFTMLSLAGLSRAVSVAER